MEKDPSDIIYDFLDQLDKDEGAIFIALLKIAEKRGYRNSVTFTNLELLKTLGWESTEANRVKIEKAGKRFVELGILTNRRIYYGNPGKA